MALCTLLSEHRKKKGWPKTVFAYTLDHKVRPESTSEAHTVGQWVKMMGSSTCTLLINIRFSASNSRTPAISSKKATRQHAK